MTIDEFKSVYPHTQLNSRPMLACLLSILALDDEYLKDRVAIFNYCDDTSKADKDVFFWEMLRCMKYIKPGETAYTTPDKQICLSYPCEDIIPQDKSRKARWYFTYCHECMHQLWDTFGVEDMIKKKHKTCNHTCLNIASDVVINDFLANVRPHGKMLPLNIWTPEHLKEKYGIEYNRRNDNQYSLYMKMMALDKDKFKELEDDPYNHEPSEISQPSQQTPPGGGGGGGDKPQGENPLEKLVLIVAKLKANANEAKRKLSSRNIDGARGNMKTVSDMLELAADVANGFLQQAAQMLQKPTKSLQELISVLFKTNTSDIPACKDAADNGTDIDKSADNAIDDGEKMLTLIKTIMGELPKQGGGGGGGNNDKKPHSPAWITGWNKALEDYKNGKIKL